jgi:hypothetical protein
VKPLHEGYDKRAFRKKFEGILNGPQYNSNLLIKAPVIGKELVQVIIVGNKIENGHYQKQGKGHNQPSDHPIVFPNLFIKLKSADSEQSPIKQHDQIIQPVRKGSLFDFQGMMYPKIQVFMDFKPFVDAKEKETDAA